MNLSTLAPPPLPGYEDFLVIPKGAMNIMVSEMEATPNYIAVRLNGTDDYLLNGYWFIQVSTPPPPRPLPSHAM